MIWLVGNRGMLGREVESLLARERLMSVGTDREIDITDEEAVQSFLRNSQTPIEWIINCAAYTAVDRAEEEPNTAYLINVDGPRNLARVAEEAGATLLHISTDYVFDGGKRDEYSEEDPPGPLGVYAQSKYAGELAVQASGSRHFLVRTAWLYGRDGVNFVETMLRLFGERDEVRVVNDQRGSPTWARDLAGAILAFIEKKTLPYGVYHFTNEGFTTWFEFAREILRLGKQRGLVRREVRLMPITTAEYPTRAKRPANSVLSKQKITQVLGLSIRPWQQALDEYLAERAREIR